MRILALDCSGSACSAAVVVGDQTCLSRRKEILTRGHAERIIPMVSDCLDAAGMAANDLDGVAATVGPGAFTGLRIGLAAAMGVARAIGQDAVGVRVTDAIAQDVPVDAGRPLIIALDSRRAAPFCAIFTAEPDGLGRPHWVGGPPVAVTPTRDGVDALMSGVSDAAPLIAGSAAKVLAELIPGSVLLDLPGTCDPAQVGYLAARAIRSGTALPPIPLYLRAPDVSDPSKDRFRASGSAK